MSTINQSEWRYYGQSATSTLTAADTWTNWTPFLGKFDFSISGAWVGTITLQRSFDRGVTSVDVERYTANIEDEGSTNTVGIMYRAGFQVGEYTSGAAIVRISQ